MFGGSDLLIVFANIQQCCFDRHTLHELSRHQLGGINTCPTVTRLQVCVIGINTDLKIASIAGAYMDGIPIDSEVQSA